MLTQRLYCGHENAIEVLDVAAPGHGNGERIKTSRTKGDKGGQKGASDLASQSCGDPAVTKQRLIMIRHRLCSGVRQRSLGAVRGRHVRRSQRSGLCISRSGIGEPVR